MVLFLSQNRPHVAIKSLKVVVSLLFDLLYGDALLSIESEGVIFLVVSSPVLRSDISVIDSSSKVDFNVILSGIDSLINVLERLVDEVSIFEKIDLEARSLRSTAFYSHSFEVGVDTNPSSLVLINFKSIMT